MLPPVNPYFYMLDREPQWKADLKTLYEDVFSFYSAGEEHWNWNFSSLYIYKDRFMEIFESIPDYTTDKWACANRPLVSLVETGSIASTLLLNLLKPIRLICHLGDYEALLRLDPYLGDSEYSKSYSNYTLLHAVISAFEFRTGNHSYENFPLYCIQFLLAKNGSLSNARMAGSECTPLEFSLITREKQLKILYNEFLATYDPSFNYTEEQIWETAVRNSSYRIPLAHLDEIIKYLEFFKKNAHIYAP